MKTSIQGGFTIVELLAGVIAATITGCIVATGDLTLKKDFNILYDASQLPASILPGFTSEVVVADGFWSEVFQ